MSITAQSLATCSRCGERHTVDIYRSINVSENPDLRQKVRDGSLFVWTCPDCGQVNLAKYETLYHDSEKKLMIWLYPNGQIPDGQMELVSRSTREIPGYILRIVSDITSLMEKVLIFEDGLNDIVIEMCKWVTRIELASTRDAEDASRIMSIPMHYHRKEEGSLRFTFPENGKMLSCNVGMNVYEDCKGILERNPQIADSDGFRRIDGEWISSILQ